jgi:hypothetical protein
MLMLMLRPPSGVEPNPVESNIACFIKKSTTCGYTIAKTACVRISQVSSMVQCSADADADADADAHLAKR